MAIKYSVAVRTAQASALITEAGTGCILRIYTGSQPANVATAASGTLLAQLTIAGALGTASAGAVTLGTVTADSSADAAGAVGWFRIFKSDGTTAVVDGSATVSGGGGDLQLSAASTTVGATVSVTSGTITMGSA
jgi:hypothetical protein